jgi:hypothetical protein
MIVNDEFVEMWLEVMTIFRVIPQHLSVETDENPSKSHSG